MRTAIIVLVILTLNQLSTTTQGVSFSVVNAQQLLSFGSSKMAINYAKAQGLTEIIYEIRGKKFKSVQVEKNAWKTEEIIITD